MPADGDAADLFRQGAARAAAGDMAGAADAWRATLASDPTHRDARVNLCVALVKAKRWAEAASALEEAERHLPGDARLPAWLGQTLTLLRRPLAACAAFRRALALNPADQASRQALLALGDDPGTGEGGDAFRIPPGKLGPDMVEELLELGRRPSVAEDSDDYWRLRNAHRLLSHFSWDLFGAEAMRHYARIAGVTGPPPLEATGLHVGVLDPSTLGRLRAAFDACEPVPFACDDTTDGYHLDPRVDQAEMREHTSLFFRVSEDLLDVLGDWLAPQADDLARLMGHAWQVRQVWAHAMRLHDVHDPQRLAAVAWHTDGAPLSMKKIMIYLNGASSRLGSTEFHLRNGETRRLDGPPGVWALFENSAVKHRALVPHAEPRPVIELLLVPALANEPRPEAHTTNCGYPWFPWPFAAGPDDAVLPAAFRRDALARRINARLLGLARAVPTDDLTMGIDDHHRRRQPGGR